MKLKTIVGIVSAVVTFGVNLGTTSDCILSIPDVQASVEIKNETEHQSETRVIEHDCEYVDYFIQSQEATETVDVNSPYISEINLQILNETASVFNSVHYFRDYGFMLSPLGVSFGEQLDVLMPMALAVVETGGYMDTRVSWTPAIYTRAFNDAGIDMSTVAVSKVNTDYYVSNGLSKYLGCDFNDADSIGPLQIRSSYTKEGGIVMPCGYTVRDLMSWSDNVQYLLHTQAGNFCREQNWNKDYVIGNTYEELMLMAVLHNSGCEFLVAQSGDSTIKFGWKTAKSVFSYCRDLSHKDFMAVATEYVDAWYDTLDVNSKFAYPGQASDSELLALLNKAGIDYRNYADVFGVKQVYPVRALLNYLALGKLYGVELPMTVTFCH